MARKPRNCAMTPFVLKNCTKLPAEPEPCWDQFFDRRQQIWVSKTSGRAVILDMQGKSRTREFSQFGETTVTRREGEGHDPSGASAFEASQFGETTVTKADGEGVDLAGIGSLSSSVFGESTKMTVAPEAVYESPFDGLSSQFGETTLTATVEGADQSEITSVPHDEIISREAIYLVAP
jgi:hypothetical protein